MSLSDNRVWDYAGGELEANWSHEISIALVAKVKFFVTYMDSYFVFVSLMFIEMRLWFLQFVDKLFWIENMLILEVKPLI